MISSGTRRYLIFGACQYQCDQRTKTSEWSDQAEKTHVVASDVDFGEPEELVAFRARLDDFFQGQVHPRVTVDEMAVQGLPVLQLHQHRMPLGCR